MHRPQRPPHTHTQMQPLASQSCVLQHIGTKTQNIIELIFKETLRVKINKNDLVWIKLLQEVNDGEILHVSPE